MRIPVRVLCGRDHQLDLEPVPLQLRVKLQAEKLLFDVLFKPIAFAWTDDGTVQKKARELFRADQHLQLCLLKQRRTSRLSRPAHGSSAFMAMRRPHCHREFI